MSDLPSREEVRSRIDAYESWWAYIEVNTEWQVLAAYASGRLVDREAIDYEAGTHALLMALDEQEPDAVMARATIAAAIGDTDSGSSD